MFTARPAFGDYIITDVAHRPEPVHVALPLAYGFTIAPEGSAPSGSCGTSVDFSLPIDGKWSCTERLELESNVDETIQTQLPQVCIKNGPSTSCAHPATPESIAVSSSPSQTTTLSVTNKVINFVPGKATRIVIENTGSFVANHVRVVLPGVLKPFLSSQTATSACNALQPGSNACVFTITLAAHLPQAVRTFRSPALRVHKPLGAFGSDEVSTDDLSIEASNADSDDVEAAVVDDLVTLTSLTFQKPSTDVITLNNGSDEELTNLDIILDDDNTSDVSIDMQASTCEDCGTLAPQTSCTYSFTAGNYAYGASAATNYPAGPGSLRPGGGSSGR
jgi:hypothetical protein